MIGTKDERPAPRLDKGRGTFFRALRRRPQLTLALVAIVALVIGTASPIYAKKPPKMVAVVATVAGNGTAGYVGDKGVATSAELNGPCGVAVDPVGNVLFSDTNNNAIRALAETTGTFYGQAMTNGDVYTIAGNGTSGYSGDGGPHSAAGLSNPDGLTVDSKGNVVISDTGNEVVRYIPAISGIHFGIVMLAGDIYTVAGNTEVGFAGAGGQTTSAELGLESVAGVAVDQNGNLIITDGANNVIWVVANSTGTFYGQAMTAGDIYIIAGNGQSGYSGDGGTAIMASLDEPEGVAVDTAGNVVFADDVNDVIRVVAAQSGDYYGTAMTAGDIYTVGPTSDSQTLIAPEGLTIDSEGNVIFADAGNEVVYLLASTTGTDDGVKITAGGLYAIAGSGTAGYAGDGGNPRLAEFNSPCAVAVDSHGDLFVADGGNNVIRKISLQAKVKTKRT